MHGLPLLDNQEIMVSFTFNERLEEDERSQIYTGMHEHFREIPILGSLHFQYVPNQNRFRSMPSFCYWTSERPMGKTLPFRFWMNPMLSTRNILEERGIVESSLVGLRGESNFISPNSVIGKISFEEVQAINLQEGLKFVDEVCYRLLQFVGEFLPINKRNKLIASFLYSECCIDTLFNTSTELLRRKEIIMREYEAYWQCRNKNIVRYLSRESQNQYYYMVENPEFGDDGYIIEPFRKLGAFYNKTGTLLRFEHVYNMQGSEYSKKKFRFLDIHYDEINNETDYYQRLAEDFYRERFRATEEMYTIISNAE